jgi:DNA-binding IclR family transcriptional regulator
MAKSVSPATGPTSDPHWVPAVERAFAIIRVLAAAGPLSLAEVVEASSLNKSTVLYTLRTLATLDVVSYDEATRSYVLGPALMEFGSIASSQFSDVAVAKRNLAELLDVMNVTIALNRRKNPMEFMMIDKVDSSQRHRARIVVQTGETLPVYSAAVGRAFLAFDDPRTVDRVLKDGMQKFTPKSITDASAFHNELISVRERGWAVDFEGFSPGVSTVAAPIFGADGQVALVACIVEFASVMTEEIAKQYGESLRRVCDRIGNILGWKTPTFVAV